MLFERISVKKKDVTGENGVFILMDVVERLAESTYQLANNNTTIEDNLAMQLWTASWHGTAYPSKVVDSARLKALPQGLQVIKATEDGVAYSMANPAWTFEKDTVKITDINGIISANDYTATFLIL